MRKLLPLIIAITSFALVCPVPALSGPGGGDGPEPAGGTSPGTSPGRGMRRAAEGRGAAAALLTVMYDPQTVITLKGDVKSLGTLPPMSRLPGAIRSALLKTDQGNITVYLSPDWHLAGQKISPKVGDRMEVTGSKVTLGDQPSVIVKDLKLGGKTINLRNGQGVPVWHGQRPPPLPVK